MDHFVEGETRYRAIFRSHCVDDDASAENLVRVVDIFVDELNLAALGFGVATATGRPGYHPAMLLRLYLYGYDPSLAASQRGPVSHTARLCGRR